MIRKIEKNLIKWKNNNKRKPLLIRGARQVGKTYSVRKLGETFNKFLEVNFEEDENIKKLFNDSLTPFLLCEKLSAYYNKEIIPGKTLLFFDEIQNCPRAISSLRFFYEKMPKLHIIATGSLLEFAFEKIPSMGVGRIKSLFMYPLSFNEFLTVLNEDKLLNIIKNSKLEKSIDEPLHKKIINIYKTFQLIGGLPEVVDSYIKEKNIVKCFEILDDLLITFKDDFAKYKKRVNVSRILEVFNSVAIQAGEKFKYSKIDSLASPNALKDSLDLLEKSGIIYKITHSSANGIPLGAEVNNKKFKVILFDTGLHQRMLGINIQNYIALDNFEAINKGAMAEIFAGLEILKYSDRNLFNKLYYWHKEAKSSNAEIDYVVQVDEKIIPIEVKSGKTGTLKSLHSFINSHKSIFGLKISLDNFTKYDKIISVPLYAINNIFYKT
ncbi:ATP-binding protein [bacterium]|nr:ATP-binding protein [bacterium]